jgi:hypothetical protein
VSLSESRQEPPPRRFVTGADAIATAQQKIADLKAQIDTNRHLSPSLASTKTRPRGARLAKSVRFHRESAFY